jgi:hypothetical protein
MPFYEIVYETGNVSVGAYEDDAAALAATGEQDRRAREGESAGPQGGAAERVAKIYKYAKHPNDYNPDQTMNADQLKSEFEALLAAMQDENGTVNIDQLALEVRALSSPSTVKEHPHDSQFKMKEEKVLTLKEGK